LFFKIKDMKPEYIVEFKIILTKYFKEYVRELGILEEPETKENIFILQKNL